MRKFIELLGFFLFVAGISGAIDRIAVQPILGGLLNVFNRVVIPRLDFLTGYELFANLTVSVLGLAVMTAASRLRA
ncbi:hypothetical protein [Sphaerimonospora thailandensis]|uniref:Uncharacterized protein n=1 Tax=Sphaerimonospora thailandensis TaxID=795644 RepID=A0A8J3VXH9_9ACTN|nr:hypothetical protein [Sphaerimonospora thailandensis]GIH68974.1 hypothetical protein Mth01_12270 [Sphaerimonospora thailandensis]